MVILWDLIIILRRDYGLKGNNVLFCELTFLIKYIAQFE